MKIFHFFIAAFISVLFFILPANIYASNYKILAVMSYDDEYAWVKEIKQGIESVLDKNYIIKYFSLGTKKDFQKGREKAKQAYALYNKFQPDGVIAADDNAQSMFVVPYLKDRVKTPVIFCGVNAGPEKYAYPASNVTGILERVHFRNSIAFAQQLLPSINKITYLIKESPTSNAVFIQFKREQKTYPAHVYYKTVDTLENALSAARECSRTNDALFYGTMEGIKDKKGNVYSDKDIIPIISKAFAKPVISNNLYHVEYGTLCAVIKTGQEQGKTAAQMLEKALKGTPVSQIPVTKNKFGKQVINLSLMKSLGISPPSEILKNTLLVGIKK